MKILSESQIDISAINMVHPRVDSQANLKIRSAIALHLTSNRDTPRLDICHHIATNTTEDYEIRDQSHMDKIELWYCHMPPYCITLACLWQSIGMPMALNFNEKCESIKEQDCGTIQLTSRVRIINNKNFRYFKFGY